VSETRAILDRALADRYTIEDELGRGGMGTVFLAEDRKHHRRVAIKVLQPDLSSALGPERFQREIEIAAGLSHPAILPLHDSGAADGLLYYVMPVVDGESLRDRLRREKQLPLNDAVAIGRDVAEALAYAHEQGVVHRDIKPENIMLHGGRAVVADFGIARALDQAGGEHLTETGMALGTPDYMSPEQAAGEDVLDGRSDIYSLGCVLYEMLAGTPPYTGVNSQAILAKKAVEPVPSLRVVRDTIPVSVEAVITKSLAKVAADRFASADEVANALVGAVSGQLPTVQAPPDTNKRFVAVAAGIVVVALVALFWFGSPPTAAPRLASIAVLPFDNSSGDPEQDYFVEGMHTALIGELAQIGNIRVISRRSAMRYRDSDKSIPEIAAELGVDGVVEASVLRQGDSVHLDVQLIEAVPIERHLWNELFGCDTDEVLEMHSNVARAIARNLDIELTERDEARLASLPSVSRETYEAYLKGMYFLNKGTPEDFQRGLAYFHEAVDNNPADPLAYAGLALGYVTLGHSPASTPEVWSRARAAALRAVTLDSTLAEAWAALADMRVYHEWDWDGAREAFEKANALNPSLAMNHYHWAWFHVLFDRIDEAIVHHTEAQRLDPLTPMHTSWLGALYYMKGDYQRGIDEALRSLEYTPDNITGLLVLGMGYQHQGNMDSAVAVHERMAAVNPAFTGLLARTYAVAGREDEARAIVAQLEAGPVIPWTALILAGIYAPLGDRDAAFYWLNQRPAHAWLPWIRTKSFWFDDLHDDPRMVQLLEEMDLPMPVSSGL
jgi:serine/threonine-protein kinase